MKPVNCRYCKTDDIWIRQHSNLWKVMCNQGYCLVVQCCDTKEQAIERWNEINVTNLKQGAK